MTKIYYESDNLQVTEDGITYENKMHPIESIDTSEVVPWRYNWQTHLIIGLIFAVIGAVILELFFKNQDQLLAPVVIGGIILGFIMRFFIAKSYSLYIYKNEEAIPIIEEIKDKKILSEIDLAIEQATIDHLKQNKK